MRITQQSRLRDLDRSLARGNDVTLWTKGGVRTNTPYITYNYHQLLH